MRKNKEPKNSEFKKGYSVGWFHGIVCVMLLGVLGLLILVFCFPKVLVPYERAIQVDGFEVHSEYGDASWYIYDTQFRAILRELEVDVNDFDDGSTVYISP